MTKLREPLTHANAVALIIDHIGATSAAHAVGLRTERQIHYWADQDSGRSPNVAQAVALDAAYIAAGGIGAPMRDAHEAMLSAASGEDIACQRALGEALAEASEEMGDALAAAVPLIQPGASRHQISRALREAEQAHGAVGRMLRRVKSFLPTAARGCTSSGQGTGGAQ